MDFKKFSSFIIAAGLAVFLYGAVVFLANQPVKAKSENPFEAFGQTFSNIGENISREPRRQEAKKEMLIGGIIVFVGYAMWKSSKSEAKKD